MTQPERDNVTNFLTIASRNDVSASEVSAALDTIAAIRSFLDRLERQIAAARTTHYDDWGSAS